MAIYTNEKLYTTLKELEVIDLKELDLALAASTKDNVPLGNILLDKDLITDENLGKVLSDLAGIPFVSLSNTAIPDEILKIIPEIVAHKQKIISFKKDAQGLHLAMADPSNVVIQDFVEKKTGLPVIPYIATERDIDNAFAHYSKDVTTAFDDIIAQNVKEAKGAKTDPPIIKIVDTILTYAYQNKTSDIHIEPLEEYSLIRFRIDGILHDIVKLPLDLHQRIVTRIKVLSKLRTDEHQAAQDGKLQYKTDVEELDVRVSILPITRGEKIVMRLLSSRSRQFSLTDLGFAPSDLAKVENAYAKPYGMLLSTGPTGSGKTTSMYAILKLLNKREVNIATIEDPVEYEIEGVNQIQVNAKTNLTFANGLRSILRQDPNIILVGEIRDEETAGIAVNSAMTGHLVLSTLHTNDTATSIPRLLDMGIEPYLVASTVNVIVAQRLVRKIHSLCRTSEEIETEKLISYVGENLVKRIFFRLDEKTPLPKDKKTVRVYKGKGCTLCHDTGYEGRIGIYEVMEITDEIREAIIQRQDASIIKKISMKNGMKTMIEDGMEKIEEGLTTIDEVLRVSKA